MPFPAGEAWVPWRARGRSGRQFRYGIEVTDTSVDREPQPRPGSEEGESGRGLILVEALADRWGWAPGWCPLKTVWAELRLP